MISTDDAYKLNDALENIIANSESNMTLASRINDSGTATIAISTEVNDLKEKVIAQGKIIEFLMDEFFKKTSNIRQGGMYTEIVDELYPLE